MTSPPYLAGPARGYYRDVYVGPPGRMLKLAVPDAGIKYPASRAGTITELLGGGVGKVAQKRARRTISYSWSERHEAESAPAHALYAGLLGEGPFIVMDPTWRNLLCYETSAMPAWGAADQTLTTSASGSVVQGSMWPAGPSALTSGARWDAGYTTWTGGGATADTSLTETVRSGTQQAAHAGTVTRTGRAVPYIASLPYTFSCLVRGTTGPFTVSAALYNMSDALAAPGSPPPAIGTQTTNPYTSATDVLVQVTIPANYNLAQWTNPYIVPALRLHTSGITVLTHQWMMRASALSATNVPWAPGGGCPRVIIDPDADMGSTYYERRSMTLTLREM